MSIVNCHICSDEIDTDKDNDVYCDTCGKPCCFIHREVHDLDVDGNVIVGEPLQRCDKCIRGGRY